MALTHTEFLNRYPRLYHMAQAGSWPSIQQLGLLSTSALLDRFEIDGDLREAIESHHRPECVEINHPLHGHAIIRDQKPMSEKALLKCLRGASPREWYEFLNRRVFFWVTEERVNTLLNARAYKNQEHDVLTINAEALIAKYGQEMTLSPINSGSTVYDPKPRGLDLFNTFESYPFELRKRYGKRAVAELSITYSVPDLRDFVISVERRSGTRILKVLHQQV
jgi:hypothetical protein